MVQESVRHVVSPRFASLVWAAVAACGPKAQVAPASAAATETQPALAAPTSKEPSALQASMRSHFEGVRQIELTLLFGHLDAARFHARALSTMANGAQLRQTALLRVRETASQIAASTSMDSALPLAATLAGECGDCHEASRAVVQLPTVAEPGEDGSLEGRMSRHQWAADRIWEGLVAPSTQRWQEGLAVLAEDPLPPDGMTDDRSVYGKLETLGRELASQATTARGARTGGERTYAFGKMLQVCSACHILARR